MKKKIGGILMFICFLYILGSCQSIQSNTQEQLESKLSSDNGQLDLSQSTPEQQNIEKAQAKESLMEAKEKRIVVLSNFEEILSQNSTINIAVYARQTSNSVGERTYNRMKVKKKK